MKETTDTEYARWDDSERTPDVMADRTRFEELQEEAASLMDEFRDNQENGVTDVELLRRIRRVTGELERLYDEDPEEEYSQNESMEDILSLLTDTSLEYDSRFNALVAIQENSLTQSEEVQNTLIKLAKNDPDPDLREEAIVLLDNVQYREDLEHLAVDGDELQVRRVALWQLDEHSSESTLHQQAAAAETPAERSIALNRLITAGLAEQSFLIERLEEDESDDVKACALRFIKDLTITRQYADDESSLIRTAVIEKLDSEDDADILNDKAVNDQNHNVRISAAKKVTDIGTLKTIALEDTTVVAREIALGKLENKLPNDEFQAFMAVVREKG